MIYDCFLFFNEFDVLEWRLHELESVVDRFVLLESTVTFQNTPKPLYFAEQKARYEQFLPRIRHIIVEDTPALATHPMVREVYQRNQLVRGFQDALPGDWVLISDVDEIPRASTVATLSREAGTAYALGQTLHHDFINLRCLTHPVWYGTRMARAYQLLPGPRRQWEPQTLRVDPYIPKVPDAGWHFSFLGGVAAMQAKLAAWSHYEWNRPPFNTVENLTVARETGRDWDTDRAMRYAWVPVDEHYPRYLREALAQGRFREHVGAPQTATISP